MIFERVYKQKFSLRKNKFIVYYVGSDLLFVQFYKQH